MPASLTTAIRAANTFAAHVFRPCLIATLAIIRPSHRLVQQYHFQVPIVLLVSTLLLGGITTLVLSKMLLWIPLFFAVSSVLMPLISARHWLYAGVPLGMLAYTLCLLDLTLLTFSRQYQGLLSGRIVMALTITWLLVLPVCCWMVIQTWRFGEEVLTEEAGIEMADLGTW
ncbi:MAG: hypothetical protein Q9202_005631 [Teloschistes flavicans]